MSDRVANVRASARRRTDFQKQVDDHTAMHVVADAILPARAAQLAADVIVAAIIQENNRVGLGGKVIDSNGKQSKQWDRPGAVERVVARVKRLSVVCRYLRSVVDDIVSICFAASNNLSFLDTDEIPTLVGVAYGVRVAVRRECPQTAREWVLGRVEQ